MQAVAEKLITDNIDDKAKINTLREELREASPFKEAIAALPAIPKTIKKTSKPDSGTAAAEPADKPADTASSVVTAAAAGKPEKRSQKREPKTIVTDDEQDDGPPCAGDSKDLGGEDIA